MTRRIRRDRTLAKLFRECQAGISTLELRDYFVGGVDVLHDTSWVRMGLCGSESGNMWVLSSTRTFFDYWTQNFPGAVTEEDKAAMEPYFSLYLLGE